MMSSAGPGEKLSEASQLVVGALLYSATLQPLDDALAERRALALVEEPLDELGVEDEQQAIADALASDATLTKVIELPEFARAGLSEDQFRDFLRRLLDRLDAMRPWPPPPHRELSASRWPAEYANASLVGRIAMTPVRARERLNYGFVRTEDGDGKRSVLILRLRSGDEVALVSPWWPDSKDVAVLSKDPDRPASEVLAALFGGTRFTADDITPTSPPPGA